jgi:HEAT repeat protein
MSGLAAVLLVAGVASVAYLVYWVTSTERSRKWRDAATAVGLTDVTARRFLNVEYAISGIVEGLRVTIETYQRGKHEHGTRIIVGGLRHGTYQLSMRTEGVTSAIEKTFGEREIEVGDPAFDSEAYLQGAPALVRAVFDAETRQACRGLLAGRITATGPGGTRTIEHLRTSLSDNELRVEIRSSLFDRTEDWLPSILGQVVALGRRLRRPEDLPGRLADNTRREPLDDVRLANLRTLTAEFSQHAAAREALLAALGDAAPAVRLFAATALGAEGRDTLLALAEGPGPGHVAAGAITALGQAFEPERAVARLRTAEQAGDPDVCRACVESLGRSGRLDVVETLVPLLDAPADEVAVAAARAIGELGAATAEAALVLALGHESGERRVAAAGTLGRVGSPLAVVPLRNAAAAHRLDGPLRRAARQAIVEIQGRVGGASPGQLSLAEGEAGQVSLVEEDRQGQLSLQAQASAESDQAAADAARRARAAGAAASQTRGAAD